MTRNANQQNTETARLRARLDSLDGHYAQLAQDYHQLLRRERKESFAWFVCTVVTAAVVFFGCKYDPLLGAPNTARGGGNDTMAMQTQLRVLADELLPVDDKFSFVLRLDTALLAGNPREDIAINAVSCHYATAAVLLGRKYNAAFFDVHFEQNATTRCDKIKRLAVEILSPTGAGYIMGLDVKLRYEITHWGCDHWRLPSILTSLTQKFIDSSIERRKMSCAAFRVPDSILPWFMGGR